MANSEIIEKYKLQLQTELKTLQPEGLIYTSPQNKVLKSFLLSHVNNVLRPEVVSSILGLIKILNWNLAVVLFVIIFSKKET